MVSHLRQAMVLHLTTAAAELTSQLARRPTDMGNILGDTVPPGEGEGEGGGGQGESSAS